MRICCGKGEARQREALALGPPMTDGESEFPLGRAQSYKVLVNSLLETVWKSRQRNAYPIGARAPIQCQEDPKTGILGMGAGDGRTKGCGSWWLKGHQDQ